jgi:hypothetical protein
MKRRAESLVTLTLNHLVRRETNDISVDITDADQPCRLILMES